MIQDAHQILFSNCLAQADALVQGNLLNDYDETFYKTCSGNKPSMM